VSETNDREKSLQECQDQLGYWFKDQQLLLAALTHASIATHRLASNERLEFLGDSVLGLVICRWLFEIYPQAQEGDLTRIKSSVVSQRTCGRVAKRLELDRFLIVGKGLQGEGEKRLPRSLFSDVFEAVVAAIFLDGGYEVTESLVRFWMSEELKMATASQHCGNYKSELQQHTQRKGRLSPVYRLITERGPDHSKQFYIAVRVGDREFTPAWGHNKKEAEQRAAANALAEIMEQSPPYLEFI
jgi:ribonuclease-3